MKRTVCVFSDESGVFDKDTDTFFVFGGLILDADSKEVSKLSSLYKSIETKLRKKAVYHSVTELKASNLELQDRRRIFSLMKRFHKFGAIVNMNLLLDRIFMDKKTKQRYQDYAYRIGLKNAFKDLIYKGILNMEDEYRFTIVVDQHHSATNGKYELEESLLQEFKVGTYNKKFTEYFEPIFKNTKSLKVISADSKDSTLIRAADIVANRLYYEANHGDWKAMQDENMVITRLP